MADNGLALLCMLHPQNEAKQERCLNLLRKSAREYYRQPKAKCTTWSYFTPLGSKPDEQPVVGGLEIYTEKSALQAQIDDAVYFQA